MRDGVELIFSQLLVIYDTEAKASICKSNPDRTYYWANSIRLIGRG